MTSTTGVPKTFLQGQEVLAANLPGYQRRPQQEALGTFVESIIGQDFDPEGGGTPQHGMAQAGTGTGKSLGAGIPAVLSDKRVVIATSTIALMNQYVRKDIPWLQENFAKVGVHFTWAQLKGLSNYGCLSKISQNPEGVENLEDLRKELLDEEGNPYNPPRHTGDRDDILTSMTQREWREVSSTSDECPGASKCAFGEVCFGQVAKAKAQDADLVITNTAMLMVDRAIMREMAKTSEQPGDPKSVILGDVDRLIVDEAHELPEIAADYFGHEIKEGGVLDYADQATSFLNIHEGAESGAEQLNKQILQRVDSISATLEDLREEQAEASKRQGKLPLDTEFFTEHFEVFQQLLAALDVMHTKVRKTSLERGAKANQSDRKERLLAQGHNLISAFKEIICGDDTQVARWTERYGYGHKSYRWMLKSSPVDVGPLLKRWLWDKIPSVAMSATLSTGGKEGFHYMARTLGLYQAKVLDVGTPFDYRNQAMLYIPDMKVPAPKRDKHGSYEQWQTWAIEATMGLIKAAGGGALLLYTSRSAMETAYEVLAPRIQMAGYTTFMQGGDLTNKEISERFKADEDSVLFGMKSFMVGVDFSGRTCRLVIIDKLPFPVPDEPLFAARKKAIEAKHGSYASFDLLSIPMMTLTLQQAFGRLIRTTEDHGTVAILDSRLSSTGYGKRIVRGLPDCPYTTSLDDIRTFYQAWRSVMTS